MIEWSPEINQLAAALAKAQSEFTLVPKNKTARVKSKNTGAEYTYQYADLADVLAMALPCLARNGIVFSQPHVMVDGKLRVRTMLLHVSGQRMVSDGIELDEQLDAQGFGSESTYYRRYDACSMLGIAPDEDVDAAVATGKRAISPAEAEKRQQTKTKAEPGPQPVPQVAAVQPVTVRSEFLSKAKGYGWGLADVKKFIQHAYPNANGSTANLTEEQLSDALKVMERNKPSQIEYPGEPPAGEAA